ncbi:aminotransferase [Clostridium polyendosporum]|uniref:Aminotransferase n=1 Tax=Clostridium polyendosporum TaxID=69208 RepID=A0A919RXB1_9CLOT|nr:histidinol-phosphate transaminase [Clostridium polyendosporum]GIM28182.1 aminotransferase [Clostridium polyendosporum]
MKEEVILSSHGGDIYTEGMLKGRELIDYSSNINPFGIPDCFKEKISEALEASMRYPDYKYRRLKDAIREYHNCYDRMNIDEEMILLGNGASEVLDLAISSLKSILIVVPSFIEYEELSSKWGLNIEFSQLDENMNYDYKNILDKLRDTEGLILGNPNNPSGNLIDYEKFKVILDYCESHNKRIIADEAFVEFAPKDSSLLALVNNYKCLFIVRAITKFFGTPGIRFGYGISSNEEWIRNMKKKQNPWNVNCFGEHAAIYSFKDKHYIEKSRVWIREEIPYFLDGLRKLSFIDRVYDTNTNFVLIKLKDMNGQQLYDKCLKKGFVIRRAHNFRGLDDCFVRFAIKNRINNERFLNILKNVKT